MSKEKKFDTVQMTREIRDKLSKKYYKKIEQLYQDMDKIKKKYQFKEPSESYKNISKQK